MKHLGYRGFRFLFFPLFFSPNCTQKKRDSPKLSATLSNIKSLACIHRQISRNSRDCVTVRRLCSPAWHVHGSMLSLRRRELRTRVMVSRVQATTVYLVIWCGKERNIVQLHYRIIFSKLLAIIQNGIILTEHYFILAIYFHRMHIRVHSIAIIVFFYFKLYLAKMIADRRRLFIDDDKFATYQVGYFVHRLYPRFVSAGHPRMTHVVTPPDG